MKFKQLTPLDIATIRTAEARLGDLGIRVVIRDLFALGLYLRVTGHDSEGYKACSQALRALFLPELLAGRILQQLDDDPAALSLAFQPHVEFQSLIEREVQATPII
jgi:hypothetical protein